MLSVREHKVKPINGITMRWTEEGQGLDVIFLHGIPTSAALWRYVLDAVDGVHAMAWEMIGYGTAITEGKNRDISVAHQVGYLMAWMNAIGVEDAVLVGHDIGGGVAQIAAVRHPSRVNGLVLTNSVCYDSWPIPSVKILQAASPLVRQLPNVASYLIIGALMLRAHERFEQVQEALRQHWPVYQAVDSTRALMRQVDSLNVQDTLAVADELAALDIPARVVWGAADQFHKLKYGRRLARDLGAPIDEIEGGKHFVPEDHPDRIAAAVQEIAAEVAG